MDDFEATDTVPADDEQPPDFSEWDSPAAIFEDGPIRERLLDVVVQLRSPTKVAEIASRADCDTETAREYLEWFTTMGIVREQAGRPVRYERNESYLFWRRVEEIRQSHTEDEIIEQLAATVEEISAFRERFDADSPNDVSLVDADSGDALEATWEALSEWQTLEQRAKRLDAARRDAEPSGSPDRIDA